MAVVCCYYPSDHSVFSSLLLPLLTSSRCFCSLIDIMSLAIFLKLAALTISGHFASAAPAALLMDEGYNDLVDRSNLTKRNVCDGVNASLILVRRLLS